MVMSEKDIAILAKQQSWEIKRRDWLMRMKQADDLNEEKYLAGK